MKTAAFSKVLAILAIVAAQPASATPQETVLEGIVLGRVYEVDKERYRKFVETQRRLDADFDELLEIDAHEFVDEREDVIVTGRRLATNEKFTSETSHASGDYTIRETPVGTFEFSLLYEGVAYPVEQRLDLNVQLSYVAELCFVIDKEEQVAWMVADGVRRTADIPPWVPRECSSFLSECLAGIIGDDGTLPDGLLLLLAGSGATATTIGIISADQVEASPPVPQNR